MHSQFSDTKMKLCDLCRQIPMEAPPSLPRSYPSAGAHTQGGDLLAIDYPDQGSPPPRTFGYQHYSCENKLKESATICNMCRLIHDEFIRLNNKMSWPWRDDGFFITKRDTDQQGFLVWVLGEKGSIRRVGAFGCSVRNATDPLSGVFRGHTISQDSSSLDVKDIVKCWVHRCAQEHSLCGPPEGSNAAMPTRVIDVGASSSSKITLLETNGMAGHYTTLSYQWGPRPHPYELTQSNLSTYTSGIFFTGHVPQTILDAIDITRVIGIRYLWVDALCIIQDSEADWVKESAKMVDYYGNSYLTISAAASDSAYKGIFNKRDIPRSIDIPYTSRSGVTGILTISLLKPEKENSQEEYVELNGNPIVGRAWTLQERILSTRNVFYANDQLYYECNEHFLSEDGLDIRGCASTMDPHTSPLETFTRQLTLRDRWDLILLDYGSREMFDPESDKFVAISGLAQKMGRLLEDDMYVAGLWRACMVQLLFWSVVGQGAPWQDNWPPAKYRAPSWTWAHIDATICNPDDRIYGSEMLATYVTHQVTLQDELHPYGRIINAFITLHAPKLVHLRFVGTLNDPSVWAHWEDSTQKPISVDHIWDYDTWSSPQIRDVDMHALLLARNIPSVEESPTDVYYLCLLVTPVKGQESYRRIGTIWLEENAMGSYAPRYGDKSEYVDIRLI